MEMQIKRSIEKIPGGMMLVPLFLGALCHTFSPGAGKYFGSFTNGMITGTVPILAVWFFCMGASIKLSATGTVLRKSGTLVVTKIAVAWVVAAIASRIIPEHGVEVGFFAGLSTLALVAATLVVLALPMLIPWNVVGTIWQVFAREDIGLLGHLVNRLGIPYNYTADPLSAWITIVVMDVWHWTSLVALLCYAGLRSIPDAFYQAARIDGASRWAVFVNIQLPKMNRVLLIAVLLRFMDSFMIYTEPFVVTGGGPGNSTTFVSIDLVKLALGQFDLGKAAAMSIVYNLIILAICWVFYTVMTRLDARRG